MSRTPPRPNRNPFRIEEIPGRIQPFTVWRGEEIWHFTALYDQAKRFIDMHLFAESR